MNSDRRNDKKPLTFYDDHYSPFVRHFVNNTEGFENLKRPSKFWKPPKRRKRRADNDSATDKPRNHNDNRLSDRRGNRRDSSKEFYRQGRRSSPDRPAHDKPHAG